MVSTRHHPKEFPPPETPTHSPTPSKTAESPPSSPTAKSTAVAKSSRKSPTKRNVSATPETMSTPPAVTAGGHVHVPNKIILIWLIVSLILVTWDTGYVMGRPHTMPGGKWHSPLYKPYTLYAVTDYMYGWPAWNNNVGFTAAQGSCNILESLAYAWYLFVVWTKGSDGKKQFWRQSFSVQGKGVSAAVLACFASAIATFSKTILYWLNEVFSNFENIGHNDPVSLFWLWIVPNGLWLVFPAYMLWVLGKEIADKMDGSGGRVKGS